MSTFDGVIKEYPLISIDCFLKPKNYASTTYFLSHLHSDHMLGLKDKTFFDLLDSRGFSKIYMSDVSSHIFKNTRKHQHLSNYVEALSIEQPTLIILYDKEGKIHSSVTVTLLTAGHCPGSVMFLIEGKNGRVLYTGDFRLPIGSAARMLPLHENECVKPLESLYVDTTFCQLNCLHFPSREECLIKIISLVEEWVFKGPNYVIYLLCPYPLGYEFVFVELYDRFGVKTHVTEEWKMKYTGIKMLENVVTDCASDARIHACILRDKAKKNLKYYHLAETPCGFVSKDNKPIFVRKILPSALHFARSKVSNILEVVHEDYCYKVAYSTHPSLSEVRDMIQHLKPKRVYPNVVQEQTVEEILDLIINPELQQSVVESVSEAKESESSFPSLGELKSPCSFDLPSSESNPLNFFDDCYKIPDAKTPITNVSYSRTKENLVLDTDYENTEEQETMLKEEIYSQRKGVESHSKIDKYPLTWQNPLVSSDEEIFGSSPDSKSDSDVNCGTSEENYKKYSNGESNRTVIETTPKSQSSKSSESESLIRPETLQCIKYQDSSKGDDNVKSIDKNIPSIELEYAKISAIDNCTISDLTDLKKHAKKYELCQNKTIIRDTSLPSTSTEKNMHNKGKAQISSKRSNFAPGSTSVFNNSVCHNGNSSHSEMKYQRMSEKGRIGNDAGNLEEVTEKKKVVEPTNYFSNGRFSKTELQHFKQNNEASSKLSMPASEVEKSSVKRKRHASRSFRFVKKMNSSSESEDEYTFKYVIKMPERNELKSSKPKFSEAENSFTNFQNQKDKAIINFSGMGENNKTVSVSSMKNELVKNIFQSERTPYDISGENSNIKNLKKYESPSGAVNSKTQGMQYKLDGENVHNNEPLNLSDDKSCNDTNRQKNFHGSQAISIDLNSKLGDNRAFKYQNGISQGFLLSKNKSINSFSHNEPLNAADKKSSNSTRFQTNFHGSQATSIDLNSKLGDNSSFKNQNSVSQRFPLSKTKPFNSFSNNEPLNAVGKKSVNSTRLQTNFHSSKAISIDSTSKFNDNKPFEHQKSISSEIPFGKSDSDNFFEPNKPLKIVEDKPYDGLRLQKILCNNKAISIDLASKLDEDDNRPFKDGKNTSQRFSFSKSNSLTCSTHNELNLAEKNTCNDTRPQTSLHNSKAVLVDSDSKLNDKKSFKYQRSLNKVFLFDKSDTDCSFAYNKPFKISDDKSSSDALSLKVDDNRSASSKKSTSPTFPVSKSNCASSFAYARAQRHTVIHKAKDCFKSLDTNIELVDLSSDHSDDEILIHQNDHPVATANSKIVLSGQNLNLPATSSIKRANNMTVPFNSKITEPVDNDFTNLKSCEINKKSHLSDIENSYKMSSIDLKDKCKSPADPFNEIDNDQQNNSDEEYDSTPDIFLEQVANNQLDSLCQNKSIINTAWEIKPAGQSSNSSVVEELNSCSDLDDSPSLIAPTIKVLKTSNSDSKLHANSLNNSKRRKIECVKSGSFSRTDVCDKLTDKMCDKLTDKMCDEQQIDSDSTPEDLNAVNSNFNNELYSRNYN